MKVSVKLMAWAACLLFCMGFVLDGDDHFNRRGNILIADQFNNRVIEINDDHEIVWSFGVGDTAGPHSIIAPNDAERVGELTLMSGTGTSSVPDNRVILVDRRGRIVWQYGQAGVAGSGPNQLNTPVCSVFLPNGDILITDQVNERVIEVNPHRHIVWQYGMTGVSGSGPNMLNNPNSAELLENGHILIADENNNRVIEVNRRGNIVWSYGDPNNTTILNGAAFASRLEDGHTLITDSNNNRIVEIDRHSNVAWTYDTTARAGSVANPLPTRAVRLQNGLTLISDQFNDQVIAVNHAKHIVFAQGHIGVVGNGFNQLNGPYDAKVIGDYTGLTPPGD